MSSGQADVGAGVRIRVSDTVQGRAYVRILGVGYALEIADIRSRTTDLDLEADPKLGWDFEAAAIPYLDGLYNMAFRLTRNAEDAEDRLLDVGVRPDGQDCRSRPRFRRCRARR